MRIRFKYILAQLLSYALHPGLLPTLGAAYVLFVLPTVFAYESIVLLATIVFTGTYLIPILIIYILTLLGVIESVYLIKKQDRVYPYVISAFSAMLTSRILLNINAPKEMVYCTLAYAFVIVVSAILIPFFKSSAHMAGMGGFAGLFLALYEKYQVGSVEGMLLIVCLGGAVAWSRMSLKRHTLLELLSGSILGFLTLFVLLSR